MILTQDKNDLPQRQNSEGSISRRRFLALGSIAALAGVIPSSVFGSTTAISQSERSLAFYNTHTGEQLRTVYWVQGNYIEDSLGEINHILRDHLTNEIKDIDTRLLDLLFAIGNELETQQPFQVISGYRSPQTNAFLRAHSNGVAEHSLHLVGKAIDIRTPGRDLAALRKTAVALKGGGVGYYPKSDFVHVDVGRVRYW
ncbi:MAG: YcbK family protein [Alphaproteobacteria bacterium]